MGCGGGCAGGFAGGSGGGGSGNLNGNLTAPQMPYATAAHILADSKAKYTDGDSPKIDLEGNGSPEFNVVGAAELTPPIFGSKAATGDDVTAPEIVVDGQNLLAVIPRGYDGVSFIPGGYFYGQVDGAPAAGVMPMKWICLTANEEGAYQFAAVFDAKGQNDAGDPLGGRLVVPGQLLIQKTTKVTRVDLVIDTGVVDINPFLSDYYYLDIDEDPVTINIDAVDVFANDGRKFLLKIKYPGTGTVNFGPAFRFPNNTAPTFPTGGYYYFGCYFNMFDGGIWDVIGPSPGYFSGP